MLLLALEARQRGDNQRGGAGAGGAGGAAGGDGGGVITSGAERISLVELGSRYFLWPRVGALVASNEPYVARLILTRLLQAFAHNLASNLPGEVAREIEAEIEMPREVHLLLCEYMRHSAAHQQALRAPTPTLTLTLTLAPTLTLALT